MEISKIVHKFVSESYAAITSTLWKGWKITYEVASYPKKILDLALAIFFQPVKLKEKPNIIEKVTVLSVDIDQEIQPGAAEILPKIEPQQQIEKDVDIVESVHITRIEAAEGLIQNPQPNIFLRKTVEIFRFFDKNS